MKHIIFFLVITGFLLALLWRAFPESEINQSDIGTMLQLLMVGSMLSGSVLYFYWQKPGKALHHALIWLTIGFTCVVLYTGKNAILATLIPGSIQQKGDTISVRAAADGHFYLTVTQPLPTQSR